MVDADRTLGEALASAPRYLRAEVAYAVTHEGAFHLDDIMMRRTRMVYEYPNEASAALDEVTAIAAPLLGWDAKTAAHELEVYRATVAADADAATQPDDASAARARERAPDIVPMASF